jgi:hypothetical protein
LPEAALFGHLWILAARTECMPYQRNRLGNSPRQPLALGVRKELFLSGEPGIVNL